MNNAKREGWTYLYDLSKKGKDSRKIALIRGYSWVEHALTASGYSQKKGSIASRLLLAKSEGRLIASLTEDVLRGAITARHLAAHEDTVSSEGNCFNIIGIFERIWQSLKNNFINIGTAKNIAKEILRKKGILSVAIYGSLSREMPSSNDIDFMVFDDGRYSEAIQAYQVTYNDPIKRTLFCKKILDLNEHCNVETIKCRWLDISIIDGFKIGTDKEYTKNIVSLQRDPFFFLNISEDLLDYRLSDDEFNSSTIPFFKSLRKIKLDYNDLIKS